MSEPNTLREMTTEVLLPLYAIVYTGALSLEPDAAKEVKDLLDELVKRIGDAYGSRDSMRAILDGLKADHRQRN